jgi:flagellar biosynthesis protein FlhF
MKVKKFVAKNMPEAMKTIREELGTDAVILNSREVENGGFFGFFTKKSIEVIAAIDKNPIIKRSVPTTVPSNPIKERMRTDKISPIPPKENQDQIFNEIKQLKTMISSYSNQKTESQDREYPQPFQKVYDYIVDQEIDQQIRLMLMKQLLKKWYEQDAKKIEVGEVFEWLKEEIKIIISTVPMGAQFKKRYVNIVGPTGVGKTTSIAKIAAHQVLKMHKKVALITTDTYRIAAVEQLKTYAKILNIPLEVAYSSEDFKKAKEQFANYDLILIDSAGRNFGNPLYIQELKKVIDFNEEMETYLVLALTSKYKDMERIYTQFSIININKIIFTKRDETSSYGSLLNMIIKHQIGVAYITTGQNVPDDIIEADVTEINNTILQEVDNNE